MMIQLLKSRSAVIIAIAISVLATTSGRASAFWAGTVANVPTGQSLVVRKTAAPTAQSWGNAANGDTLSMTGQCRQYNARGGVINSFRIDGTGAAAQKYRRMKRSATWCEVFYEISATHHEIAWVRGAYVYPQ